MKSPRIRPSPTPFVVAALLAVTPAVAWSQAAPRSATIGGEEFALLRDVMAAQWQWYKGTEGRLCLDPIVATYRADGSGSAERWSPDVVVSIAADVRIAIDTQATTPSRDLPRCARSRSTWRVSYGRPRIHPDSAAIAFVATRLDARGAVDSFKTDFRMRRNGARWLVDGWLADTMAVHDYVNGEGCYRLAFAPFDFMKADGDQTMVVIAESARVAAGWLAVPAHRLAVRESSREEFRRRWPGFLWYVTHDSVHFQWGGGFEALFGDLEVVGDSVRGTMRFETDAVTSHPPSTSVGGRRMACR